jgi:hypothetical protein
VLLEHGRTLFEALYRSFVAERPARLAAARQRRTVPARKETAKVARKSTAGRGR